MGDLESMDRITWLVIVPTAGGFGPWLWLSIAGTDPELGGLNRTGILAEGLIPVLGAACAMAYGIAKVGISAMWALVPFSLAALCSLVVSLIRLVHHDESYTLELTSTWYGNVLFLGVICLLLQPVLALGGGLISLREANRRD